MDINFRDNFRMSLAFWGANLETKYAPRLCPLFQDDDDKRGHDHSDGACPISLALLHVILDG